MSTFYFIIIYSYFNPGHHKIRISFKSYEKIFILSEVKIMNKIKKPIVKTMLFVTFFYFLLPNIALMKNTAGISGVALAEPVDQIKLDGSVYSEEAEYYQYCLNKLYYKDSYNSILDTDGYFGDRSKSALVKFLKAQKFNYFSAGARDKLMLLAESTSNKPFNSGFSSGSNKLSPAAFVYSSISNINNSKDPFYSMEVLKEFPYIITSRPGEMSYKSRRVAEVIKVKTKIFAYVNLGPDNPTADKLKWKQADLNKVKAEVDEIAQAGWYGVFIDQFGYDWNETRARQNTLVDYIHSKGLKVMVNSWFVEDALGAKIDKVSNPAGTASHLNNNDWYLIESFFTDGDSYRADNSYIEKYLKVKQYKDSMNINVATLSYKRSGTNWNQASEDIKKSYILAQCLGFNNWWFGKTDNSDNLFYGKDPNVDLGEFVSYLKLQQGKKYVAETKKYKIEYYAQSVPTLKLIAKK